jgi:polysaccharide pyruvyl transferase CsaB
MILTTITKSISEEVRGASVAVLCRRKPRDTAARLGLKTAYAFNIPAIYRLLKQTNLFVSGGGTLITDITSTKSLIYYLFVIKMAKFCGCATMIYASGIGPFKNDKNRRRAAKVLRNVDLITLRDDLSAAEIKKMAIPELQPIVTADPVFGLPAEFVPAEPLLMELGLENKRFFIVSVRSWKTLPEDFAATLAGFTDYVYQKHGLSALFLPMMPSEDLAVSRKAIAAAKYGGFLPERVLNIEEILSLCARAEFTAAMRLHAIIYSAKMGTPVIGLSYDPKVQAILDIFGSSHCVKVEDVTAAVLRGFAEDVISRREASSARLLSISGELAEKSRLTAKLAGEIIGRREVCTVPEK